MNASANTGFHAFELVESIGEGGMGEVWRALHRRSGTPVAIKLIRATDRANPGAYRDALLREARALARVDHPAVVRILDCGRLDQDSESPDEVFVAMEFAEGGAVDPAGITDWRTCRSLLIDVLDGLAHVHARAIIHRDLKPANILRFRDGEGWQHRVADFGLAATRDRTDEIREASGTPDYMAPEQSRGAWRKMGPWTDLYALGCVAWQLTTGASPFRRPTPLATSLAHVTSSLPEFVPRFEVPAEFETWVRRLLEKEPAARFGCAADAAFAMMSLGDVDEGDVSGDVSEHDTMTLAALQDTVFDVMAPTLLAGEERGELVDSVARSDVAPAFPDDWREPDRPTRRFVDVGAGLFGLRDVPLVGREVERTALWSKLRRAAADAESNAVVVTGGAGVGKTALADWFSRRTVELGQCRSLWLRHEGHVGWVDALRTALADRLQVADLDGEALAEQLRSRLGDVPAEFVDAVASLMTAPEQFSDPHEAFALLEVVVAGLGRDRPALIVFDGVERAPFGLEFAERLLSRGRSTAALFLFTVDLDEAGPVVVERVAALEADHLTLRPLATPLRRAFFTHLLPFSPESTARLMDVAGERLAFGRQLVASLVEQDRVQSSETGFSIPPDWEPVGNLVQVWAERLGFLAARRDWSGRDLLESVAALTALGARPDTGLFVHLSDAFEFRIPDGFLDGLSALGVALTDRQGRPHVVSASFRRAGPRVAGPEFASNCDLEIGARLSEGEDRVGLQRAAHHFWRGGDRLRASKAVRRAVQMSMARDGDALHAWNEEILADADSPELLRERALARILFAQHVTHTGDYERASGLLDRAESDLAGQPDRRLEGELLHARASICLFREQYDRGRGLAEQSREIFEELGERKEIASCNALLGDLVFYGGDAPKAEPYYLANLEYQRAEGPPPGLGWALYRLACLQDETGDCDAARQTFGEALELFRGIGDRNGMMLVQELLSETVYKLGDYDECERLLLAALEMAVAAEDRAEYGSRGSLGRLYAETGRTAEALGQLSRVVAVTDEEGFSLHVPFVRDAVVEAYARAADWSRFDDALAVATEEIERVTVADEHAVTFERAADAADAAGEHDRAAAVAMLAARLWDELDQEDEAERVRRRYGIS